MGRQARLCEHKKLVLFRQILRVRESIVCEKNASVKFRGPTPTEDFVAYPKAHYQSPS